MNEPAARVEESRRAGRGFVFITGAKLYFMMAGAVIEFTLPHLLPADGRARLFGLYKVVVGIVSILNNVVVTVTIQSVSKFVAEDDARQGQVARAGFRLMGAIGGLACGAFILAAPFIAQLEADPSLTPFLRIAAGIVLAYAIYSVFVGVANGRREFHKQAGLDITFSTLRASAILGLVAAGFGVGGAIGGFLGAAVAIVGVAAFVVRLPPAGTAERFPAARIGAFFGQVGLYTLLLNILLSIGLLVLKRYASDPAQAGYYGAAQTLSVLCYQAIVAVIFVVFPLVSRATFEGDMERTRAHVGATLRYSLLLASAFASVLCAKPAAIMRIPYPAEFAAGGPALRVLVLGFVAFSLLAVAGAVLNGAGRTAAATLTVGGTLAAALVLNLLTVPGSADPLERAATATSIAMGAGIVGTVLYLRRVFGRVLRVVTVGRVAAALVAAMAVGHLLPERGKIVTLAECAAAGLIYLAVLVVSREVGSADFARFRSLTRRS